MGIKKYLFLCFFGLVFSLMAVGSNVLAFVMPSVYVQNLVINKSEFQSGEIIENSFTIFNADTTVVPGITYKTQILGEIIDGVPSILAYEKSSTDKITVAPGDKIKKSSSLTLPEGLTGNFIFRVALVNDQGLPLGWQDKEITITGLSDFVTVKNHVFLKDGEEFLPGGGTRYIAGEIPQIKFLLSNNSSEMLNLIPSIKIYERNVESKFIKEYNADVLSVPANSNNNYFLNLPPMERPEVYLASMALYGEAGKLSSNQVFFRWVITGEGANIWQATTDKTSYQAGEDAQIQIIYTGSADDEFSAGEGVLEVKIYDQAGNLAGESNQAINLDEGGELNVAVNVNQDVNLPLIKTRIIKGEKILADYGVSLAPQEPELAGATSFYGLISKIIGAAILASLIFFWLRRRIGSKALGALILFILVFTAGMIFFAGQARANVICEDCGGGGGTGVVWNSPQHGNVYKAGQDTITFSGGAWVGECGDSLWNNHIDFYITDINGQNKYVLGTDHLLPNTAWGGGVGPVYWDSTFNIPGNISIQGEARAYVYFRGQHWTAGDKHWHWARVYEHIFVEKNSSPSASIGCTSPAANCAGYTPLDPITLLNQSSDPDNNITSCAWSITGPQAQTLNACSNFTPQSLQPGSYNARLTVTDAYGLSSTANKAFSMKQDIIAKFSCSEDNLTYTENCSSLDPTINSQFFLKDLSTPSQGATVNSWQWSMTNANPSSSSLQNVITRFIAQGAQTVTLRAADSQGRTDTEQKTINTRTFIPKFKEVAP